jgi:5-hydroxyisourate hydrolase-like protein (transthyretin family)
VSVTTDENGGFTTELTVPAGTDPGDFQIVGTAVTPAEESATAPLTVVNEEASLSAQPSSVNDGGTTTVTGEGYPALAEVEVQLQDGEGNPVGDPVTVTTDSNGGFVTDLTVPAGTSEGDYVVVGVSTSGESAQAPLAVTNESTADNTADNTEVNTEVNTAENTEVNTAENDADNTEVNTAENDADNTEVNTAENDADNTEVNTAENDADNTEVNTEVNTAENDADNTEVNTAENDADNTEVNSADNTEVNSADNTEVNTAENDADNTEVNTEVNTAENDADNTEVNTEVNTADNAAENTEVNTEANTSDNTADNTARAEIDVTPKRAVQGVDDVLVTGIGYTPDGTAKAYLRPIAVPESSLMRAIVEPFAAVADPGEFLETVQVDGNGEVAFHVASSQLDVGNYVVTVIDDEDSSLADSVTFSVVPTDTSDNTADNTAENTETNTADNTEANTEVNTAENGADNTEVNTADNAEVNTADNTAENTSDNTGDDATAEDPAVSVDPGSVEAGESTTVTGENFPSNTDVEVQLVDPDGNPVGDPITATTDDDGAFETELTVPEGSAPGDYTVDASAESGENASADLTVTDPSGDDNAADNTGDNAGDNAADNTGDNSSDNAGDNAGDSTADNTADNAGENTGDNTGDDATAEDPAVSVDPGSVEAGDSTTVTGENFPPNTEVDVQLVDADGNPVGDPVSVVTDENGDFSLDVTILDGTPAGEYTVVATAETGETASAALSVTGAGDGNGADNTSDNASDNTGANTGDNTGANTGANTGGSSTGTGGISNGSSGTAGGGGSSSGGYLAQTGATGTAAMVGLAALLLIGGVAGVMISRRSVS